GAGNPRPQREDPRVRRGRSRHVRDVRRARAPLPTWHAHQPRRRPGSARLARRAGRDDHAHPAAEQVRRFHVSRSLQPLIPPPARRQRVRLELLIHPVTAVRWGDTTALDGTMLVVARDDLARHLLEDRRLADVDLQLVQPGESCRIAPVFDIVEPRAKLGGGVDFPGVLGPASGAGEGQTTVLPGAAVVAVDPGHVPLPARVLDAGGAARALSSFAPPPSVVVLPPLAPALDRFEQFTALRHASLRAAVYLARMATTAPPAPPILGGWRGEAPVPASPPELGGIKGGPATREVYELPPLTDSALPRVAYVYQVHSHQRPTHAGEPVIYGDNVRDPPPTIRPPNDTLDGEVLRSSGGMGMETYSTQNHPIIRELYRRHGHELVFAGVVVTVAHNTAGERERAVAMAANIVAHILRADGAVLNKSGGGAPHVDMAQVGHRLEQMGVRTALLAWDLSGEGGGAEGSALFNYATLDAIVNYGSYSFSVAAPAVERVLAGDPARVAALAGPLTLHAHTICGAMDQIGAGRLTAVTY